MCTYCSEIHILTALAVKQARYNILWLRYIIIWLLYYSMVALHYSMVAVYHSMVALYHSMVALHHSMVALQYNILCFPFSYIHIEETLIHNYIKYSVSYKLHIIKHFNVYFVMYVVLVCDKTFLLKQTHRQL